MRRRPGAGRVVRIEFEAVFHTAEVFINGKKAGEHVGKGYTAFAIDITDLLEFGRRNTVAVRADNSFSPDHAAAAGLLRLDAGRRDHPAGPSPRDVPGLPRRRLGRRRSRSDPGHGLSDGHGPSFAIPRTRRRRSTSGRASSTRRAASPSGKTRAPSGPRSPRGRRARSLCPRSFSTGRGSGTSTILTSTSWRSASRRKSEIVHRLVDDLRHPQDRGPGDGVPAQRRTGPAGRRRAHGRQPPGFRHGRAGRLDRPRPRRSQGAQLRLHPCPLAAGPPGPRLLRPPRHPHPARGAHVGPGDFQ